MKAINDIRSTDIYLADLPGLDHYIIFGPSKIDGEYRVTITNPQEMAKILDDNPNVSLWGRTGHKIE